MKRLIFASTLILTLAVTAAQAQTVDPASDLGQFRTLRGDGMTALEKGDTAGALNEFDKAQAILPDSPSIPLLRAQAFLKQKRKPEAKAALLDYLKRGNQLDLAKNTEFNTIPAIPHAKTGFRPHRSERIPQGMAVNMAGIASNVYDHPRSMASGAWTPGILQSPLGTQSALLVPLPNSG